MASSESPSRASGRHRLQVAASFASAAIMLMVGVAGVLSLERVSGSERWVERSQVVQRDLADVRAAMAKIDVTARSYVVTGDEETLREFRTGTDELRRASVSLRAVDFEQPAEKHASDVLDQRVLVFLQLLEGLVESKEDGRPRLDEAHVAARTSALTGTLEAVDELRRMQDAELSARRAELRSHMRALEWVIVVGTGFAVVFAMATALRLRKTFIERAAAASDLSLRAIELEQALEQRARTLQELRSGERERELLIGRLERSNRDLDQFAYVTSHDLKAPLRGIANLAGWIHEDLADGELPPETRRHLELLQDRVCRMEALIEAILQYARAGRVSTEPERVDCGELLRETIDLLSPSGKTDLRFADDLPTVFTYRMIFQQALINLLANAIKFADVDNPRIDITWADAGDFVELMVADNGAGIDSAHHSKIFKIFQTLGSEQEQEGTGIGLAVVKKTAEAVGGSVRVISSVGEGATFILRWPKRVNEHNGLPHAR
jgi:signal transduction histidine kinase